MIASESLKWEISLDDAKKQLHVLEQKQRAAREKVNEYIEELQKYNRIGVLTTE